MVSAISSKLTHEPLVIVHLKVTLLPAVRPVTVLAGDDGVVIVAPFAAPWILHNPVPVAGALPVKVKVPVLHCS